MAPKPLRFACLLSLIAVAVFSCSEKQFTEPIVNPPSAGTPPLPSVDSIRPSVIRVTPGDSATGVDRATVIRAFFSELVAESTVTTGTFRLEGSTRVPGEVSASGTTVSFVPSARLSGGATYTATLTTGIHDRAGNALQFPYSWAFTTGAQAPPLSPAAPKAPGGGPKRNAHPG